MALPLETSMWPWGNQRALAEAPATLSPLQLVSDFKQTLFSHSGCGLVMGRCRSGWWVDLMILKIFPNLDNYVILSSSLLLLETTVVEVARIAFLCCWVPRKLYLFPWIMALACRLFSSTPKGAASLGLQRAPHALSCVNTQQWAVLQGSRWMGGAGCIYVWTPAEHACCSLLNRGHLWGMEGSCSPAVPSCHPSAGEVCVLPLSGAEFGDWR